MSTLKTVVAAVVTIITAFSGLYLSSAAHETTASWNDLQSADAGLTSFTELYAEHTFRGAAVVRWGYNTLFEAHSSGDYPNRDGDFPLLDSVNVQSSGLSHAVRNRPDSDANLVIDDWRPDYHTTDNFGIVAWVLESDDISEDCQDFATRNYSSASDLLSPDNPRAVMRTSSQGDIVDVFREITIPPGEEFSICRYYEITENLDSYGGKGPGINVNGEFSEETMGNVQATLRWEGLWEPED